jgi:hypothetical protein
MKQIIAWSIVAILFVAMAGGCAGLSRGCSSCNAGAFGSDWVIVQYDYQGQPINAWKLVGVSVANEDASDGIYWKDNATGHLVHISGWYSRVQVSGGDFDGAARLLGVELSKVHNGKYQ